MKSDLIDIEVWVICTTEKAALVNSPETGSDDVWIPKSMFDWSSREPESYDRDFSADIMISKQFAEAKGLA